MRATIYRSGGIAGLRVGGTIDSAELGAELAARAEAALAPERLAAAAAAKPAPGAADLYEYEVTLESGQTYTVTASPAESETAETLEDLVNEYLSRRRPG